MERPADEGEVGLGLADQEPVDRLRFIARAAEEIADLEAVRASLLDLEPAQAIGRAGLVRRAVVGVVVRRRLDRSGDIGQLGQILKSRGGSAGGCRQAALDDDGRVCRRCEPFGGDLDPPHLPCGGLKLEAVDVGRREEPPAEIERQRHLLSRFRIGPLNLLPGGPRR